MNRYGSLAGCMQGENGNWGTRWEVYLCQVCDYSGQVCVGWQLAAVSNKALLRWLLTRHLYVLQCPHRTMALPQTQFSASTTRTKHLSAR
jgi:hypothetical protein